jgi:hypothetical protein
MVNQTPDRWKRIAEAPSYEVSDKGEVRNRATLHVLKPQKNTTGVMQVSLRDAGMTLTRSVRALQRRAFEE